MNRAINRILNSLMAVWIGSFLIMVLWTELEVYFYGEKQTRTVDTVIMNIIMLLLFTSSYFYQKVKEQANQSKSIAFTWKKPIPEGCLRIGQTNVRLSELKSYEAVMAYLEEYGTTHAALMDLCPEEQNYWIYPLSDGKHLGAFFLLVREGIMYLPYNRVSVPEYEQFVLEDIRLWTDYAEVEMFINDWEIFSDDLMNAMKGMEDYLFNKEVSDEGRIL